MMVSSSAGEWPRKVLSERERLEAKRKEEEDAEINVVQYMMPLRRWYNNKTLKLSRSFSTRNVLLPLQSWT